jgi:biotin synthase
MLTKNEIVNLLDKRDDSVVKILFDQANRIRRVFVGDDVQLRGLIEFSNYCRRDCLNCRLRRSNNKIPRYRMAIADIVAAVAKAENLGFKSIVLQSGEDSSYRIEELCDLVQKIKSNTGIAVTLSIGERSRKDYVRLRQAGADRYLLRFETFDPHLFKSLKPDSVYSNRLRCLEWLMEIGYRVSSGNIVGMPGQSTESIADDILRLEKLNLDVISLAPYIAHPDTPLRNSQNGKIDDVLRVTALMRIVAKKTHIAATMAIDCIDQEGRQRALQCGANVLMPDLTPQKFRKHYPVSPCPVCIDAEPCNYRFCIGSMISRLGRTASFMVPGVA